MLELLIYRLLWLGLVLFHIIMIFYELVYVCVNEGFGSVQAVITGPRFFGLFHKQVNFPNILLLSMHMHAHVCALGDLSGWKVQWKCKIL